MGLASNKVPYEDFLNLLASLQDLGEMYLESNMEEGTPELYILGEDAEHGRRTVLKVNKSKRGRHIAAIFTEWKASCDYSFMKKFR